jgi:hypothetical protein
MAPHHDTGYLAGFALGEILTVFALCAVASIMLVAGIIVVIRTKQVVLRACAIVGAVAGFSLLCLLTVVLLIGLISKASPPGDNLAEHLRVAPGKDNSCEISIPASWVENPKIKEDAVIVANDSGQNQFVMILKDGKQDYTGNLADYARDATDRMLKKLTSLQTGLRGSTSVPGRPAIQEVVSGEINHLRISYFITYVEGETRFYQVICWSLESKETAARPLFEKITNSFRETTRGN